MAKRIICRDLYNPCTFIFVVINFVWLGDSVEVKCPVKKNRVGTNIFNGSCISTIRRLNTGSSIHKLKHNKSKYYQYTSTSTQTQHTHKHTCTHIYVCEYVCACVRLCVCVRGFRIKENPSE